MVNLFETAKNNSVQILADYESALSLSSNKGAVAAFAAWVEKQGQISVNLGLFVVVRLLRGEQYKNTYELTNELADLCGRSKEELLQERLKSFYQQRVAFDRCFSEGEKFYYGVLNAGGIGLDKYGSYCVILKWCALESPDKAVYLSGDSLKVCVGPQGTFLATAMQCFTPHSHRQYLVAKERVSDIPESDASQWPALVCGDGHSFEAIFVGKVKLQNVERVRVSKTEYERLFRTAFFSLSESRSPAERAEISDFIDLRKAEKAGRIEVELL